MAIKEMKREWSPCQLGWVKEFLLHCEADVADLPECCEGSKAKVSETDNEYVFTGKEWINVNECDENGGGGGAGGGAVQPDWNQNDATAPDYVKNRPGGYIDYETIFSGPVEMKTAGSKGVISQITSDATALQLPILGAENDGREYVITIDGVTYKKKLQISCTKPAAFMQMSPYVLGNCDLWVNSMPKFNAMVLATAKPIDTGEDFAIQNGMLALSSANYSVGDIVNLTISTPSMMKIPAANLEHVQADMADNDPESDTYVRNRLGWKVSETEEVLFDGEVSFAHSYESYSYGKIDLELKCGDVYTVTYQDVQYECKAGFHGSYIYIGNESLITKTTGDIPFVIFRRESGTPDIRVNGELTEARAVKVVHAVAKYERLPLGVLPLPPVSKTNAGNFMYVTPEGMWGVKDIPQPDMCETDESSLAFIKNKSGGYIIGYNYESVFEESVLLPATEDPHDYVEIGLDHELVLGEFYTVTYKGVDYEFECTPRDNYGRRGIGFPTDDGTGVKQRFDIKQHTAGSATANPYNVTNFFYTRNIEDQTVDIVIKHRLEPIYAKIPYAALPFPEYTAADNGKVLGIVNGSLAWVSKT